MDAVRDGRWIRQPNAFTEPLGPPEPGRYRLYASYACPWAQRVLIVRELLGIQDLLEAMIVDPIRDERGWRVPGGAFLSELYLATDPDFRGRYTVPCVWDVKEERIVTNDFPRITLDLETRWGGALDLYPEELRGEIDALNDRLYHGLNNAVYEAGFARSQEAYEEAVRKVFATLDFLEERLSGREFLFDRLTESDVRAYTTLVRFDTVYHTHFKCSLRRLTDYPTLWSYTRRLYAIPAFRETTDFDHIKRHYYLTQTNLNPSRLVPLGPELDWSL